MEGRRGKVRGEMYEAARHENCFRLEDLYPKEERKRQKKKHRRISVARDIHEMRKRK